MSKSRRTDESDLSRIVGILILELVAGIVLINLAQYAQKQRTQLTPPAPQRPALMQSLDAEISLPKIAAGRYNRRL